MGLPALFCTTRLDGFQCFGFTQQSSEFISLAIMALGHISTFGSFADYRVHDRNMTKSFSPIADLSQRRLAYEAVLQRCRAELPDEAKLSDLVHRKLSSEALHSAARAYPRRGHDDEPHAGDRGHDREPDGGTDLTVLLPQAITARPLTHLLHGDPRIPRSTVGV